MLPGSARGSCFVASEDRRSHVDAKTLFLDESARARLSRRLHCRRRARACGLQRLEERLRAAAPAEGAVAQPLQKPVTLYLNLTGNTSPFNSVDLVARVQGFLTDIDYVDGAAAKAGDKLFGIERDQYQAQLDQANATLASNQATLAYNQAEYQRQATLGKQDFASQATVQEWKSKADEAAAQVLNAKAAIETAQINLNYTTVNAPFDGVVTRHLVDKGALVGVGSPTKLATIIQLDPLYVYFTISEPQILRIKVNNAKAGIEFRTTDLSTIPVEIGLQGEEGFPHLGHMDYAAPQVDASTGTLEVRAIFDNKARGLLPGLFVRVRTPVEKLDKAILVPDVALGTSQEGRYLLVVGQDNVVQRKIVKTGEREGAYRIIESGIESWRLGGDGRRPARACPAPR